MFIQKKKPLKIFQVPLPASFAASYIETENRLPTRRSRNVTVRLKPHFRFYVDPDSLLIKYVDTETLYKFSEKNSAKIWPQKHKLCYDNESNIETPGRAGIGVYSTALSTGLTTI
jgi:hypothetical protein